MRVIDTHRHVWQKGCWPESVKRAMAEVIAKRRLPFKDPEEFVPKIGEAMNDPDGSMMIKDMDEQGVDISILHHVDWGMAFKDDAPLSIEQINKHNCELAKKYPDRVYSLFAIDPRRPGGVKVFERAVTEWGAVGLNLFPPGGFYPNEAKCYAYYQKALDLGVPVSIHTGFQHWPGISNKYARPMYLDDIGCDFPDLVIIVNHTGMDSRASTSWWEEAVGVAETKLNFYLEIADWQKSMVSAMEDMPELMRKLKIMRDAVGAHRILFGTDDPPRNKHEFERAKKWVELFKNLPNVARKYGADFSHEETELILHGNAERIFQI
jgi:predicted TIM-barrel fold metal-dependent hydrolase